MCVAILCAGSLSLSYNYPVSKCEVCRSPSSLQEGKFGLYLEINLNESYSKGAELPVMLGGAGSHGWMLALIMQITNQHSIWSFLAGRKRHPPRILSDFGTAPGMRKAGSSLALFLPCLCILPFCHC